MSVELNHTIIPAQDRWASAKFLADILNLEAGPNGATSCRSGHANGVTLDFADREDFRPQHYRVPRSARRSSTRRSHASAPAVSGITPRSRRERPGEINHRYGGRGVYFDDPNGHLMELITQPYGPTPRG